MPDKNEKTKYHPDFTAYLQRWIDARNAYSGEKAVKAWRTRYLPMTSLQLWLAQRGGSDGNLWAIPDRDSIPLPLDDFLQDNQGAGGDVSYQAELVGAHYPELVKSSVDGMNGLMHKKPLEITPAPDDGMDKKLESIIDHISFEGDTLQAFAERLTADILITGRAGILIDPSTDYPKMRLIPAERILLWQVEEINGNAMLKNLTLDFTHMVFVPDGEGQGTWEKKEVLHVYEHTGDGYSAVQVTLGDKNKPNEVTPIESIKGVKEIPFVFFNTHDNDSALSELPLSGLINLSFAIYRAEAAHRRTLRLQGDETLVLKGISPPKEGQRSAQVTTGAGSIIYLPPEGDAKFVGPTGSGLREMREALEDDYQKSMEMMIQYVASNAAESGEALKMRMIPKTAILTNIQKTCGTGLTRALQMIAQSQNIAHDDIQVHANLDFGDLVSFKERADVLLKSYQAGAISRFTFLTNLFTMGLIPDSAEDEEERIKADMAADEGREDSDLNEEDDEEGEEEQEEEKE